MRTHREVRRPDRDDPRFRALGRLAGPRFSGLALGLPSTTAVVLIFCGCEQGSAAATEMAESGLLGLVAALALPLAFIASVRLGWPLWGAIAASVGGYIAVAAGLGCLPAIGVLPKVCLAAVALLWRRHVGAGKDDVTPGGRGSWARCRSRSYGRCSCARPRRRRTS